MFVLEYPSMELVIVASLVFFILYLLWSLAAKKPSFKRKVEAPCLPGYLPILGHFLKIWANQPLTLIVSSMADKMGPVFTLWIGRHRLIVVSNAELAKECLTTNDKVFSGRMENTAMKHLTYNYAMFGFGNSNEYWRQMKKAVNLELLSPNRIERMKCVRSNEVDLFINDLYHKWANNINGEMGIKVEMREWFGKLMFNNIVRTIVGKRYFCSDRIEDEEMGKAFRELSSSFFSLAAMFVLSDAIPWLEWADIGGYVKEMKKTAAELDKIAAEWLVDHRLNRKQHDINPLDQDFIDILLSIEEKLLPFNDSDTIIKSNSLVLIFGGADTNYLTMTWALALLMNNRNALIRAQEEVDEKVGRERNVIESDIENLPYLQAIIKEAMRLYPAGPLLAPHRAMEDCTLGGYHVPAGTILLTNVWKIQRDPAIWTNPEEFRPERFLGSHADVNVKGRHFGLIPFGSGRRMCPGVEFSNRILHLALARLIHGFRLDLPAGNFQVDMTVGIGQLLAKADPLEVVFTPRLPPALYM